MEDARRGVCAVPKRPLLSKSLRFQVQLAFQGSWSAKFLGHDRQHVGEDRSCNNPRGTDDPPSIGLSRSPGFFRPRLFVENVDNKAPGMGKTVPPAPSPHVHGSRIDYEFGLPSQRPKHPCQGW